MQTSRSGIFCFLRSVLQIILILAIAARMAPAQQACPPVHVTPPDPRLNIFTDRQEMDLGDAIAEQVQRDFLVIDDEDYTGYLQRVGKRLLAQAPPTDLKIQFFLSDLPVANALSLPGGRVYVSRKIVALAKNEDEIAGVLGHELGHVLTHQPAMTVTMMFRGALGVTEPGTREEIFKNYEQLEDSLVRKRKVFAHSGGDEKQDQLIADQIGMQLIANAGYSPQAFPDIFDRIADTRGRTGSWLSDMFGATSSESKRLREILKQTPSLNCGRAIASNREEFQKWQASVINYTGLGHKERLNGVISKVTLNPSLRSDIRKIRYSPDGKYLFAQDESTIFVMNAATFTSKFAIYAPEAFDASFSPDSRSIVFHNPSLRVESWSVGDETRSSASEVVVPRGCMQTLLSPDGKYLACYGKEFDLSLYDVQSNSRLFQKKDFYEPRFVDFFILYLAKILGEDNVSLLHMRFSPDARFLVAHSSGEESLVLNLDDFHPVSVPGSVRSLLSRDFSFIGPDKIVGVDAGNYKNSGIVTFPSGESVKKIALGKQSIETATNPRYLLLRPIVDHAVGVMDLQTDKIILASEQPAADASGSTYVRERIDGDIAMFDIEKAGSELKRARLPVGQLGRLQAFAVSPDLHWLAISSKSRGAVWNLLHNERAFYVRGFNGAVVSNAGVVDADIAKFDKSTRHLVHLDSPNRRVETGMDLDKTQAIQFGSVLLRTTPQGKDESSERNILFEALDVSAGKVKWSRTYAKNAPDVVSRRKDENLVLSWPANSEGAKIEIRSNAVLSQRWPKVDADGNDYFLEAIDPTTGKILGATIVRTGKGSFRIGSAESAGDWLVAEDGSNRLHVISLQTGEQKGLLFGRRPALSGSSGLLAAENERGELSLYDLKNMTRREQYIFTKPITYVHFAADNRRMLVLTGDQTVFFLALPRENAATN